MNLNNGPARLITGVLYLGLDPAHGLNSTEAAHIVHEPRTRQILMEIQHFKLRTTKCILLWASKLMSMYSNQRRPQVYYIWTREELQFKLKLLNCLAHLISSIWWWGPT